MARGWIKLHRSIQDNELWLSEPFTKAQAWIDLLLLADAYDEGDYRKGNVYRSIVWLSARWKWSRGKTRLFLSQLESHKMIQRKSQPKGTVITIVKWEFYQSEGKGKKPTKKPTNDTTNCTHIRSKEEKEEAVVLPTATDLIHGGYR